MNRSNRLAIWVAVNICFVLLMSVAASQRGGDSRVWYLSALFALCSTPLLFVDRLNGPYVLLAVFAPFYFILFGMLDVVGILFGTYPPSMLAGSEAAEWGILAGMTCILLGYMAAVRFAGARGTFRPARDWPQSLILIIGVAVWLAGSAAILYLQIFVMPEKTIESSRRGLASMGPLLTFVVLLGNLVAPLGMLILTYGYARFRTPLWFAVILGLVLAQVSIGFVTDVRGQALTLPVLIIVALTLIDNKLPKAWLLGSLVGLLVLFPILSAYRAAISGERGLSRADALQNISKVVDIVLAYRDTAQGHEDAHSGKSAFFERMSIKENVERVFTSTGVDVPFQYGITLAAIPLAFVPRLILPDKFDVPTGLLFNRTFYKDGDVNTNISPSGLGELYWNFGWPGLVTGTLILGTLLGLVASKCSLAEYSSITRMLILLATAQYLCIGFEGGMSVSYILWLRSLGVIGILHLLFARVEARPNQNSGQPARQSSPETAPAVIARFPNIMR
jgi:hypothetical protein